ncbi:MAG: Ig-like domain-containing protein, partial [Gemmatimonadota bacterium]|nr:Ig-like domain-containing protein [Gemmatimonadota bacterium]
MKHFCARRAPGALAGLTLAVTMLGACDGANLFGVDPVTQTNADRTAPVVDLAAPVAGSVIALKDSVRVIAKVTDNQAIAFVEFSGFALRGDPALGTQQKVSRFGTKRVTFTSPGGRVLTDTTVARDLIATADSVPETGVYVVATAQDTSGNISADTVLVSIGGPRVRITTPSADSTLRAGSTLTVRVAAEDRIHGVASVRVRTSGVTGFARDTTLRLALPLNSVDTVVVFAIPTSAQGDLVINASAASAQGGEGTAPAVGIRIAAASADQTPPRVSFSATVPSRLEISDSISVRVTATDEIRVDTIGATVLVIDRVAGVDRLLGVLTRRVAVAPPTGTVTIQLPLSTLNLSGLDTLTTRFEVIAFARDGAGNCAAATAPNVVQSAPCRSGPGGATVSDVTGAASTVFLVRGRTIPPPAAGDSIADLISDGTRVFASNRSRNRVEVLPVGSLSFAGSVLVGSRPYGLALSPDRSTLLVANSGGAGSISRVPLGGSVVPAAEDRARRIITDNVVIHVVRFRIDESSGRVNLDIERREYSDLPRFLAQTTSGNILYGTIPTEAAPGGTVQNYSEAGVEPVTDVFVEYAVSNIVADQFVVRRADRVERIIQGTGQQSNHQLRVCDHRPGEQPASICFPRDPSAVLTFQQIQDSLKVAGTDVVFDFSVDPNL